MNNLRNVRISVFVLAIVIGGLFMIVGADIAGAQTSNRLDYTLTPYNGTRNVSTSAVQVSATSGGIVNVNSLDLGSGCKGFASRAPDFRVHVTNSRLASIFISFSATQSGKDTTLIVNDSEGNWHCNDDYRGLNPGLSISRPESGQYDIWVGSYYYGNNASGMLRVSPRGTSPGSTRTTPAPSPSDRIDLRGTTVASELQRILNGLAQGNERRVTIEQLELRGTTLHFNARIRHQHSWGFATAYSLTTSAHGRINVLHPNPSDTRLCVELPSYVGGEACATLTEIVQLAAGFA